MFFQHIYDKTLAQGSYFIGCQESGEAIVIDAKRDIDTYLEVADEQHLKITHIAETHIHADYLCGSRELAAVTGATIYLSDECNEHWEYVFKHQGLKDGQVITLGNISLKVMHTPGHTPESISFLLTDHAASDQPFMIFTGDFVFVGDVGRPDLLETAAGIKNTKRKGAEQMFHSLKRFIALPDYIQVWPAHGAGSACGKSLGAIPSSTVGYEKRTNWALQFGEKKEEFIKTLLEGQPEPPKYFAMMKHLNRVDRPLQVQISEPSALTVDKFLSAYHHGIKVIDTRPALNFYFSHFPNSINVINNRSFATWMGWIMNYQEQFVLIADEKEIKGLSRKLMRIGLDNIYGYFSGYEDLLWEMGESSGYTRFFETSALKKWIGNEKVQILDVREKSEFDSGHIKGAKHLFVGTMKEHLEDLDKNQPTAVYCQSGNRSTIAFSLLKKYGFKEVVNYGLGIDGWLKDGETLVK